MTDTIATIKAVADYLRKPGETLKEFTQQWSKLTDQDKIDLRTGIGNGTYDY